MDIWGREAGTPQEWHNVKEDRRSAGPLAAGAAALQFLPHCSNSVLTLDVFWQFEGVKA